MFFNGENSASVRHVYRAQQCPTCQATALQNVQGKVECLACDEIQPDPNQVWGELSYGWEIAALSWNPIFYGCGVKPGDGSPVMLLPGFMAGDSEMLVMSTWLQRIGYKPYLSGFFFNITCPNLTIEAIAKQLRSIKEKTNRKVVLIGHSKGGVIARALATRYPELVRSIITLGAPFGGLYNINEATSNVIQIFNAIQFWQYPPKGTRDFCYTAVCPCGFGASVVASVPKQIDFTAISSRSDRMVRWSKCFDLNAAHNIEVNATHFGMVYNPEVYRSIAYALAYGTEKQANGKWVGLYDSNAHSILQYTT
jgi:pimeloyl-ACP methyl ester carboxylesterase